MFAMPGHPSPLEGFTRAGKRALALLLREVPAQPTKPYGTSPALYAPAHCAVVPMTLLFHLFGPLQKVINAWPKPGGENDEQGNFGTNAI